MRIVRAERTGWRDQELSLRHRAWGWDCPAVDIDFLMVEYDKGEPVAVVEYKHENAPPQSPSHPSYRALVKLADRAGLPMLFVRYAADFSWFRVTPLNDCAMAILPARLTMTEQEWVTLLYRLRGREVPLLPGITETL